MIIFSLGLFHHPNVIAQEMIYDMNTSTPVSYISLDSSIHNYSNSATLDESSITNNQTIVKTCPQGYSMIENACRPIPSQQPDSPASVPLCPPGYFALTGGFCESIQKHDQQ
ncbi:MAG: hypothetical protein AB7I49_04065 [Candidatus Nitrosocosmicus sp.]